MRRRGEAAVWMVAAGLGAVLGAAQPGTAATLLPLASEDAAPITHGTVETRLGVSYFRNRRFPPFTPKGTLRSQDLVSLPNFGVRVGAGDWVEIQASFEFLSIDETFRDGEVNDKFGGGDARLFTKVRLREERGRWPALGLRFGAKLPNANKEDRLGTDATDFAFEALVSRDFGALAAHVNLGFAILGGANAAIDGEESFTPGGQDDLFTWGLAAVGRPIAGLLGAGSETRLVAEVRGNAGTHFDNDFTDLRVGAQAERGAWLFYLGGTAGIAGAAEDVGVVAGVVYRFRVQEMFAAAQ